MATKGAKILFCHLGGMTLLDKELKLSNYGIVL